MSKDKAPPKVKGKPKKKNYWPLQAAIATLLLAMGISIVSEFFMRGVSLPIAFLVLLVIVGIGISFDIVGTATASALPGPFSAMAVKRVWGAKQALTILNHASLVASVCNDVVGDVCGIVSGAAGAAITVRAIGTNEFVPSIVVSSVIAAATVGGKALGKNYAMNNSTDIVLFAGRVIALCIGKYPGKRKPKQR